MGWDDKSDKRIHRTRCMHQGQTHQPELRLVEQLVRAAPPPNKISRAAGSFFCRFFSSLFFFQPPPSRNRSLSKLTNKDVCFAAGVLPFLIWLWEKVPGRLLFLSFGRSRGLRKRAAIKALRLTSVPRPLGRRFPCPACRYIRSSGEPVSASRCLSCLAVAGPF